jgi:phospholipid/cholesterol/gamma-HCH transport system substrate-binding protein
MSDSRLQWKIGLFVVTGLGLIVLLMLTFHRGLSLLTPTYELRLKTTSVGGIKPQAAVLLSGIIVGSVVDSELAENGRSATILVKIRSKYKIHADATFSIDALGFLGDQYIAIRPRENKGPLLTDGDEVVCLEPFDLQEVARASLGFIHRVDETAQRLNSAIKRVDEVVLNEATLTNLAITINNFRAASDRAVDAMAGIDNLFKTNSAPITTSLSNVVEFSELLNKLGGELSDLVTTNRGEIQKVIQNLEAASHSAKDLMADAQAGKGAVGALLKDERMRASVESLIVSANSLAENLATFGTNLNQRGLWSMLWKPKQPKTNRVAQPFSYPGKH